MAEVDYFLRIDGIDGESQDKKHKNEIDVLSWSWGESQSGPVTPVGAGAAGQVRMQDFRFEMQVNEASPKLMLACDSGEHFRKAVLTCRKGGGKDQLEFLKLTFSDVLVSSYQLAGSAGSGFPLTDQVSLSFSQILFEYTEQNADGTPGGTVKAGWDVKTNRTL